MRQERKPLGFAVDAYISDPLTPVPVQMLHSDARPARNITLYIAEDHSPTVRTADVSCRRATRAARASYGTRIVAQACTFAFVLVFTRPGASCARTRIQHPVDLILQACSCAGDSKWQPHIRAPHQVVADPAIAHVHEVVANRQYEGCLRGVCVGAAVSKLLPAGPRSRERCCCAVIVVVRIPSCELRGEHEVDAVLLDNCRRFVFLGPCVHIGGHCEVVG